MDANCPQCGAGLSFRSADLAAKVCPYCRSMLVRDGDALARVGEAAEVPDDVSPLQLGVRAQDGEAGFELVGRVRWRWTDGGWNEWFLLFDDGAAGWLSEAGGRHMLTRPAVNRGSRTGVVRSIAAGKAAAMNAEAQIDGTRYVVSDAREAVCVGAEGDLPFAAVAGTRAYSVDLAGPDGACASVQRENGRTEAYVGRFVTLADLRPRGLRRFEGWPLPGWAA